MASEHEHARRVGDELLALVEDLRGGTGTAHGRRPFSAVTLAVGVLIGVLGVMVVPDPERAPAPAAAVAAAGPVVATPAGAEVFGAAAAAAPVAAAVADRPAERMGGAASDVRPPTTTGPTRAVRGVTATKIKIGVAVLTGGEALTGKIEDSYRAVIDGFRRSGQLPVHGRDIELVFRDFPLTGNEAQMRAACVSLGQDEKVFAAFSWFLAPVSECLAREFRIPSLNGYLDDETMKRSMPYVFVTNASVDTLIRNAPHWAHEGGYLENRKLGLYYRDSPRMKRAIEREFKPRLASLGYQLVAEVAADESPSSPALAVQRFRAAGVDTVFLQARPWDFGQAAEAQVYRPKYLMFFTEDNAQADGLASYAGALPQQFDGSWSMTANRYGETGANGNPAPPVAGVNCQKNYERFTGRKVPRSGGTAQQEVEWQAIQLACDESIALLKGLQVAGRDLDEAGLIRAWETSVQRQQSGLVSDISWSARDHFGGHELKTNQFSAACICWLHRTGFRPVWA